MRSSFSARFFPEWGGLRLPIPKKGVCFGKIWSRAFPENIMLSTSAPLPSALSRTRALTNDHNTPPCANATLLLFAAKLHISAIQQFRHCRKSPRVRDESTDQKARRTCHPFAFPAASRRTHAHDFAAQAVGQGGTRHDNGGRADTVPKPADVPDHERKKRLSRERSQSTKHQKDDRRAATHHHELPL